MPEITPEDLLEAAQHAVASLSGINDADWEAQALDLDWSRRRTLDHLPDALLFYATHLARRSPVRLPSVRNGDEGASPQRLLEVLPSAAAILADVARVAGPDARAYHPAGMADPCGFLAMACDELLVHTSDIAVGLGIDVTPELSVCQRVLARLFPWAPTDIDAWDALLWANGRSALPGRERLGPDWYWHCAPLDEWDGTITKRQAPPAW